MVAGPCGRCARPVVARVAPGPDCRRGALDNEERGRAISATADTEQSEGVPIRRDWAMHFGSPLSEVACPLRGTVFKLPDTSIVG